MYHITLLILSMMTTALFGKETWTLKENSPIFPPSSMSCHASTIVELENHDLLVSWFAGEAEGKKDVSIWLSRRHEGAWSKPIVVAEGNGKPCWNPVLFELPSKELLLFYRVGPSPRMWTSYIKRSKDHGVSWSEAEPILYGCLGPIKNKPLLLEGKTLLCPSSIEAIDQDTSWLEISNDEGKSFIRVGPIHSPPPYTRVLQPALVMNGQGDLVMLMRPRAVLMNLPAPFRRILVAVSKDRGKSFSPAAPTSLPNPDSGFDAISLPNGHILLAYNHHTEDRSNLSIALSPNGIDQWETILTLQEEADEEFSYPAMILGSDGLIHITYTSRRSTIHYAALQLSPSGAPEPSTLPN